MAGEKIVLTKIFLAQVMLDNPLMKLQCLHHLVTTQVITVIGQLARRKNKLKHIKNQIACEQMSHILLLSDLYPCMIRMSSTTFLRLCDILVRDSGLTPTLKA